MLVGFVETKNFLIFFGEKFYIYYLARYPVSSKIIGRISGGRISGQISIRYNPNKVGIFSILDRIHIKMKHCYFVYGEGTWAQDTLQRTYQRLHSQVNCQILAHAQERTLILY